jgi:hypothetical protein
MKGEYRLFRQGGGRGAFAHVRVEVVPWNGQGDQIVVDLHRAAPGSATPEKYPDFFEAAANGCRQCMQRLKDEGHETERHRIVIDALFINLADTRSDAVLAAAFLATASAFGLGQRFQLTFQGDGWRVIPQKEA